MTNFLYEISGGFVAVEKNPTLVNNWGAHRWIWVELLSPTLSTILQASPFIFSL
jgi:hypothetical protein